MSPPTVVIYPDGSYAGRVRRASVASGYEIHVSVTRGRLSSGGLIIFRADPQLECVCEDSLLLPGRDLVWSVLPRYFCEQHSPIQAHLWRRLIRGAAG